MNISKKENISIQDFTKLNIVLGTILKASKNQKAKLPAYILYVDFVLPIIHIHFLYSSSLNIFLIIISPYFIVPAVQKPTL